MAACQITLVMKGLDQPTEPLVVVQGTQAHIGIWHGATVVAGSLGTGPVSAMRPSHACEGWLWHSGGAGHSTLYTAARGPGARDEGLGLLLGNYAQHLQLKETILACRSHVNFINTF